jgi:thymidylate synthase ThyX
MSMGWEMTRDASDYIVRSPDGKCGIVVGLPEEVVAMLFAFFSRNPKNIEDTLQGMLDDGSLEPPEPPKFATSDRARKFHERMTIGYGHKSVADHAQVHMFVEGASTVSERDFMSARLMAATSKSTRYVNFSEAGWHRPEELQGPNGIVMYHEHVQKLMDAYKALVPIAVEAVRAACPKTEDWSESHWLNATEKRGLDAVRDILPACVNNSYAFTMSATGLREMLDKRDTSGNLELKDLAKNLRLAARSVVPTLVPKETRRIPGERALPPTGSRALFAQSSVQVLSTPDWETVERMLGIPITELMRRWDEDRGHHLPPDRTAEFAYYDIRMEMPFAIARDLGRHRMMTQLWSEPGLYSPFGVDPILSDAKLADAVPQIGLLSVAHQDALTDARWRMRELAPFMPSGAAQYACPLATMVVGAWRVNLRELYHLVGLSTTPQGHPAYRKLVQALVFAIKQADPIGGKRLESVTNFSDILVGRPT